MRLVQDRHINGEGGSVEATGDKYINPTEALLKEVSAEYARMVQTYPDYKFDIMLDTVKGLLKVSWTKL